MYTFPSVTINNVTFTAKRWGQFPTITYTSGATQGSEVVTVASDLSNITIQIASGSSTNQNISDAIANAKSQAVQSLYASDLVSVSIANGHTADTNTTHTAQSMSGAASTAPSFNPSGNEIPVLASDPSNPSEGRPWYNATTHLLMVNNGSTNVILPSVQILSADPSSPFEGQVWYNTTTHLLKFYDGTTTQTVAHV